MYALEGKISFHSQLKFTRKYREWYKVTNVSCGILRDHKAGTNAPPPLPLVNDHLSYIKTSRQKILISLYPRSPSFQTEANSFTIEKNFTFPVIDREKDLDPLVAWSIRFARSSVRVTRGRGGTTIESKTYASRSSNVFTRYVTFRFNAFYGSTANTRFSPCVHVVEVPREYWWAFKMN